MNNDDNYSSRDDEKDSFSSLDPEEISYEEFYRNYLVANRPCIFRNYLANADWNATTDWTKDGKPDFDFFLSSFGADHSVPVSYCNKKYFNSQVCETETLSEYYKYWTSRREEIKYLKDWHFVLDARRRASLKTYSGYSTPHYFSSDWLNEWLEFRGDQLADRTDYRFVYIGPKGSFTPFHSDVFGSFSWSANVAGVKRWTFVVPGDEAKLRTAAATVVDDVNGDQAKRLEEIHGSVRRIEIVQNVGDVMFVPSGWYHQVYNEEDTLSINHNWFNAANIQTVLDNLDKELTRVEHEISDCRDDPDWNNLCQNLLREHHGMNHKDLLNLIILIIKRRAGSTSESIELAAARNILQKLCVKFSKLQLIPETQLCQEHLLN